MRRKTPAVPEQATSRVRDYAEREGWDLHLIDAGEMFDPEYLANPANRCYFCKSELYERLRGVLAELGIAVIVNGTNTDDLGDFRPGLQAADEYQVRCPLVDCGFAKSDVREIAQYWELSVWDKPASPCLSSRIAYGEEVTIERLQMVDRAESWLKSHGFRELRVRFHKGELARIELTPADIARFADREFAKQVDRVFRQLGFRFVTIDLAGFQSGNMNRLIAVFARGCPNLDALNSAL